MEPLQIIRVNNLYWVPRWQDWMGIPLTGQVSRYDLVENSKTGKKTRQKKIIAVPCYSRSKDTDEVLFPAGLLKDFITAASQAGVTVIPEDKRNPNPMDLVPVRENIPDTLRHKQDETIDAIIANDKGIIKCNTGFGKSYILRVMTKVYPTAKIVICTASKVVVEQIYDNLVKLLGSAEVGLVRGGTADEEGTKRVVVSTCASLMRTDIQHCDFLFFDEVHNVGFNKVYEFIYQHVGPARMFGFTASLVRGDGALAAIKSLFGEVIATCSYQEAVIHKMVTPIRVFMPPYKDPVYRKPTDVAIVDERIFYWDNWNRNRFIGTLTEDVKPDEQLLITVKTLEHAVMLQQIPALANFELIHAGSVAPAEVTFTPFTDSTAPDTLEVINKTTKAEAKAVKFYKGDLGGYLVNNEFYSFVALLGAFVYKDNPSSPAGYKVKVPRTVHGIQLDQYKMTKKQVDEKLKKFASGELKRVIATPVIKEGGDFNHLAFMIRADGSSSGILNVQFPGRASRLSSDKEVSIVLDPFDTSNDWVKYRSIKRWKYYHQEGWI